MFIYNIMNDVIQSIQHEQYCKEYFLSSPDTISGIYVLQERSHCWTTIYV